jgi:hypothetical protein
LLGVAGPFSGKTRLAGGIRQGVWVCKKRRKIWISVRTRGKWRGNAGWGSYRCCSSVAVAIDVAALLQ